MVRVKVSLQEMNVSWCNILWSDGDMIVYVCDVRYKGILLFPINKADKL